jgi:hypothetical protein
LPQLEYQPQWLAINDPQPSRRDVVDELDRERESSVYGNTIASVVTVCANCSTFEQLQARARSYFGTFSRATPPGYSPGRYVQLCEETEYDSQIAEEVVVFQRPACTMATIVSDTFPLSATFELTRVYTDNMIGVRLFLISPLDAYDTETAFRYDEETFARISAAAALPDIEILSHDSSGNTIDPGYNSELLSPVIAGTLQLIGPATGTTILNNAWQRVRAVLGLSSNPSAAFNFRYNSTIYTVSVGQTITIKYSNGWTEKFRFAGLSTLMWRPVPGSLRDAQGKRRSPRWLRRARRQRRIAARDPGDHRAHHPPPAPGAR